MNALGRTLFDHPRELGISYFEHMRGALGIAGSLLSGGIACTVHAVVPALFTHSASRCIARLHALTQGRGRRPVPAWIEYEI